MTERVNSTMIYYNFCKCHNVPTVQKIIKINLNKKEQNQEEEEVKEMKKNTQYICKLQQRGIKEFEGRYNEKFIKINGIK
jgi:hypothetical protein